MKMKILKRVTVLVVCCALTGSVALAAPVYETIKVTYNNIKIVVDGVEISPKDANGKAVEPFIYNGTTYLPVRAIGDAIGKEVGWDGSTSTVYLGAMPDKSNLLMVACPPYEKSGIENILEPFEMMGKTYTNGFTSRFYVAAMIFRTYLKIRCEPSVS